MRYLVDAAVFAVIFVLAQMVFENGFIACLAACVIAGAAEAVQGTNAKRG